jgi:hypothetical protein
MLSVELAHPENFSEGQSYTLTCTVRGGSSLRLSSTRFQWSREDRRMGGSEDPVAGTLTFSQIRHSDTGEYRCTATFESPYLTGTYTTTGSVTVAVVRKPHA